MLNPTFRIQKFCAQICIQRRKKPSSSEFQKLLETFKFWDAIFDLPL